ncbi:diguanylate cyclase domain-containing protein [Oceanisphaera ostreae]|uniref:Diguanylate cyclase domain-containing protein n=1 Tax=Oceanisphaera ostreae TaxID=914151 RepID=A0ABW3KM86_9GAMM
MLLNYRRVLLFFMASMVLAELAIMLMMKWLGLGILGFWLVALFDATAVSLTAIILLWGLTSRAGGLSTDAQLKTGAIVFVTELLVMLMLPMADDGWLFFWLDAVLLSVVSGLLINWQVLLPLQRGKKTWSTEVTTSIFWGGLCTYLSLMTCAGIILLSVYQQQQQQRYEEVSAAEMSHLDTIRQELLANLHEAALDLTLLAGQAERLVSQTGLDFGEPQLATDYMTYLKVRRDYAMLRLIDSQGEERVRVERSRGQEAVNIPAGQRQNKWQHDYFGKAMQLAKGEIYISELELNIEHGQIEIPYNPVIRLATPFFDEAGNKRGIVIINLMAERLLQGLSRPRQPLMGQLILLHKDAGWLYGVEKARLWGSVLDERRQHRFANSHPEVWDQMQGGSEGISRAPEGLYVYQKLTARDHPVLGAMTVDESGLQPPQWWLISVVDRAVFEQDMVKIRHLLLTVSLFFAVLTAIGILLFSHTLKKRIEAERKLHHLAHFDFLTGLANRALFSCTLQRELQHSRRSGVDSALFYMDLDNFKPINDRLGHNAGDTALKEVARRLQHSVRPYDTVARMGGDEFAILMTGPIRPEDIDTLAKRILNAFDLPVEVAGQPFLLGVSIGVTLLHQSFTSHEQALAVADQAMYNAKKTGKHCFFLAPTPKMSKDTDDRS